MDLEGDEERAYIFFDAKNRSTTKDGGGGADAPPPPSVSPHLHKPASIPAGRGRKTPPVAQRVGQPLP